MQLRGILPIFSLPPTGCSDHANRIPAAPGTFTRRNSRTWDYRDLDGRSDQMVPHPIGEQFFNKGT